MPKLNLNIFLIYLLFTTVSCEREDDLIDISNITVFPQDYSHDLRAGYLNITAYNQALYYILAER